MKKQVLIDTLQNELERTYHNATLHSTLTCDSDFECDLVQNQVQHECEDALADLKYTCPEILEYGKVYTWGRGGRTVCPDKLISQRGGSSFRVKSVDDLEMNYTEMRRLLRILKAFNDHVESFCRTVSDDAVKFIREKYQSEIEEKKGKKRQHFSGVRYI